MTTLEIDVGDLQARAVEFTATELVVTLMDGRKIVTPLDWYPRLERASAKERAHFELTSFCRERQNSTQVRGLLQFSRV